MFLRNLNFLSLAAFLIFFGAAAGRGSPTKDSIPVVVSLKPLHSLTCALMEGRGCPPVLMLEGNKIPWKSIDASCVQRTKFNSISSPNLQNTPLPLTDFMQNPWVNKPLTLLPPDFQDPLQGWARIWDSQKTVKIHPRVLLHSSEGAPPDGPQSPGLQPAQRSQQG